MNASRQRVLAKQRACAFYLVTRVTGCVPPRCEELCYLGKPGLQHPSLSHEVTEHPVWTAGVGGQGLAWEGRWPNQRSRTSTSWEPSSCPSLLPLTLTVRSGTPAPRLVLSLLLLAEAGGPTFSTWPQNPSLGSGKPPVMPFPSYHKSPAFLFIL